MRNQLFQQIQCELDIKFFVLNLREINKHNFPLRLEYVRQNLVIEDLMNH